jgi:hypothetical protein
VNVIAGLPKARAPVNLDEAIRAACERVEGITAEVFRSLLSPEDVADIEAGGIHPKTLHAYGLAFAVLGRGGSVRMTGIHCALQGRLGVDVEMRRSESGKDRARLSVGVGEVDELTLVSVAVFEKKAS